VYVTASNGVFQRRSRAEQKRNLSHVSQAENLKLAEIARRLVETGELPAGRLFFQALDAALALAMVFVIQHTQARQQAATQRKLDEILQALPGADNSLLALEHASDDELRPAGQSHREIRQAALDEQSGPAGQAG
jgi:low affinity iron permease